MVEDITKLLQLSEEGSRDHHTALYESVYSELRRIAGRVMSAQPQRDDGILQPTALVNEAYLRLVGSHDAISWQSRAHFYNVAALCMRRILVDAARSRHRAKREGGLLKVDLDHSMAVPWEHPDELIAIDSAIEKLSEVDARCAEVVNLRFFLGFSIDETADLLKVSTKTVKRDWEFARVWLEDQLQSP